jgi:3-hydroxyisobutyrate dehydrogenase-like beta-hydroxyacid dehydrogenase
MREELKIGFIGFGEAGFHLARGLRRAGLESISAYDINTHTPSLGERIQRRAAESEVVLVESNAELAGACEIVLSTVTANRAQEAAGQTASYLDSRHLYADLNSVSPALKQTIKNIVEARGARFVEIAIMSPVPPHGIGCPYF